jgi:hypothetical protein
MCEKRSMIAALVLCSLSRGAFGEASPDPHGRDTRPITLPAGTVELTLLGNYSTWRGGSLTRDPLSGESGGLGVDIGLGDRAQIGLAAAVPLNPGATFGSAMIDATFAVTSHTAVRLDFAVERAGTNGGTGSNSHWVRNLAGAGLYMRLPLSSNVEFVWGRPGAIGLSRFLNLGINEYGTGGKAEYAGGSFFPERVGIVLASGGGDTLMFSTGSHDSGTIVSFNIPLGILVRPVPQLSLTLQAGYAGALFAPQGPSVVSTFMQHFVPVGLEAVLSPIAPLDVGVNVLLDNYIGMTPGGLRGPGLFDQCTVLLWFRLRLAGTSTPG